MAKNDPFELTVSVEAWTPHALLLDDGGCEAWVPRSQVTFIDSTERSGIKELDDVKRYEVIRVEVPEWVAEEKGFV